MPVPVVSETAVDKDILLVAFLLGAIRLEAACRAALLSTAFFSQAAL
jgi:hypothetical protein